MVAAPRRAQVCTQPLLVGLEQNLLAAILASTRLPPPLCLGGYSFRRVLPRFPECLFHPHGYPSWLGPLDSFAVVALHVLGLHATPVLYGRTEPPGRLPSCARLPLKVIGLPRLSPRLSGFRRGFFILTVPDPRWASLRPFAAVVRGVLRSARYPCPFGLGQHLLAASIPAPGLSSRRVASPGVLSLSPQLRFPARDFSPHGSWTRDEPICHRLAVAVPRLAKVCKLPLHNFG